MTGWRDMEIGVDIIEVSRIKDAVKKWNNKFLNRIFTEKEQKFCEARKNKFQSYAGKFAVKEALLKAFGTGLSQNIKWKDIEIIGDKKGKPKVNVFGKAKKLVRGREILLSISHTKEYAVAFVILGRS